MVGTKVDITERKRAEEAMRENEAVLQASHREIQDLAGRLIAAQEVERARIARDLHDDLSQQLAGLSIALSGVKRRVAALPAAGNLPGEVSSLQQRTLALAENIRHLSHDLHPSVLEHAGLVAALAAHCAGARRPADRRGDVQRGGRLRVRRRGCRALLVPGRPGSAAQRRHARASPPRRGPAAAAPETPRSSRLSMTAAGSISPRPARASKAWGWSASRSASGSWEAPSVS